ncbi:hypothetical protein QAD02_001945 [Eretmocerus hayati]|uniref:Uncharacterized protein n=1 Tax=Eretmocerus hayati TaxID=131215 RepID=A0ACC2NHW0_9HYME|nr:hypothetical protein QAD02_001945 [Eretmocerus hayati]
MPILSPHGKILSHLRHLSTLGVTVDKCASMLYPLVESSSPEELLRVWQRPNSIKATEAAPDGQTEDRLSQLIAFLKAEVESEVRVSIAVGGFQLSAEKSHADEQKKDKPNADSKSVLTAHDLLVSKSNGLCLFCESAGHASAVCAKA